MGLEKINRVISYVVASDNGLAPNTTGGSCTLTVCKPVVRKIARPGEDIIVGFSTSAHGRNRLIYAMTVEEKLPYADYFSDERFQSKKPDRDVMGDNFFDTINGHLRVVFSQAAHWNKPEKIRRDLSTPMSVISTTFWYFGNNAPQVPLCLNDARLVLPDRSRRGHRITTDKRMINLFMAWLSQFPNGVLGSHRDSSLRAPSLK